jgi:hypothetical protein
MNPESLTPLAGLADYLRLMAHSQSAPEALHRWADEVERIGRASLSKYAQSKQEPEGWRPIETAPQDGARILLLWKHRPASVGWWTDEESGTGWKCDGDMVVPAAAYQSDATHWQPLPPAPAAVSQSKQATPPEASEGCDFCRNPLFAGLRCKNCGRNAPPNGEGTTPNGAGVALPPGGQR